MDAVYYIQINLICVLILILFRNQIGPRSKRLTTENRIFSLIINTTVLLCVADMIAGIYRGQFYWGARPIIQISNLLYFLAISIISYLWMLYINIKIGKNIKFDKINILQALPLAVLVVIAILNPITEYLFIIDEQNLYVRNFGVYIHWVITWIYLIIPTIQIIFVMRRESNKQKNAEIKPLMYFIIAPVIASIVQMLFYGISTVQVGITLSIVITVLYKHRYQMYTDILTGLNNRYRLNKYLEDHMHNQQDTKLTMCMIDLNNFKEINDMYSHLVGDAALKEAANVLKQFCGQEWPTSFLCRYGGDEFIIVGRVNDEELLKNLKQKIEYAFEKRNKSSDDPYLIEASVGVATGKCDNFNNFETLLMKADQKMYRHKKLGKI
ncbi:MAG: diguanylate cyclase domain-containing protein [Cellulosilyticaceae bacterium]